MSPRRFGVWVVLILTSTGLLAGCDGPAGNPTRPSAFSAPAGPNGTLGPKRLGPTSLATSTEIQGPASIEPGQSAQYTLVERLKDSSTRVVARALWSSSDPGVIQVTSSGLATAQSQAGEVVLSARIYGTTSKEVLVLPANTFRVIGTVREVDGAPIANARVDVTGGPSATTAGSTRCEDELIVHSVGP